MWRPWQDRWVFLKFCTRTAIMFHFSIFLYLFIIVFSQFDFFIVDLATVFVQDSRFLWVKFDWPDFWLFFLYLFFIELTFCSLRSCEFSMCTGRPVFLWGSTGFSFFDDCSNFSLMLNFVIFSCVKITGDRGLSFSENAFLLILFIFCDIWKINAFIIFSGLVRYFPYSKFIVVQFLDVTLSLFSNYWSQFFPFNYHELFVQTFLTIFLGNFLFLFFVRLSLVLIWPSRVSRENIFIMFLQFLQPLFSYHFRMVYFPHFSYVLFFLCDFYYVPCLIFVLMSSTFTQTHFLFILSPKLSWPTFLCSLTYIRFSFFYFLSSLYFLLFFLTLSNNYD